MLRVEAEQLGPLLILGIVLVAGAAGGWVARGLKVPGITGNIIAGCVLGLTILHEVNTAQVLQPLSTFAISLIAVSAGGHFSYRRIHNALRRILSIALFEVVFGVAAVFTVLTALGADWKVASLMACLAAGTAPATTVALIRENRARGPFVKTLLAVVTVDSSLCILLFAFAHSLVAGFYASGESDFTFVAGVQHTLWMFAGSVLLGGLTAFVTTRLFVHPRFHDFSTMVVAILFASGGSILLGFSPLLTCLLFGVALGNGSSESERQLYILEPIEPLLYTCFFTMAGVALHLDLLAEAGLLCGAYILARACGKGLGAAIGARLAGSSRRIIRNIPLGFVPQAGVALGLVVILEGDARIPPEVSGLVGTLVLAAVAVNEIIGPLFTRMALRGSREAGLDRPRLMEFLEEEFIVTDLTAEDKWEALDRLTDFFGRVHHVKGGELETIRASVIEREEAHSTAMGHGAAIPHGRVETGRAIQGVLGIFPEGVEFGAPDGKPVMLVALIVTPQEHEQRHLEVLASLSAIISNDRTRVRLASASDANDAWETIESEETRTFNYFLEGDDAEGNSAEA